jgi:hypothetical protein
MSRIDIGLKVPAGGSANGLDPDLGRCADAVQHIGEPQRDHLFRLFGRECD